MGDSGWERSGGGQATWRLRETPGKSTSRASRPRKRAGRHRPRSDKQHGAAPERHWRLRGLDGCPCVRAGIRSGRGLGAHGRDRTRCADRFVLGSFRSVRLRFRSIRGFTTSERELVIRVISIGSTQQHVFQRGVMVDAGGRLRVVERDLGPAATARNEQLVFAPRIEKGQSHGRGGGQLRKSEQSDEEQPAQRTTQEIRQDAPADSGRRSVSLGSHGGFRFRRAENPPRAPGSNGPS